MPKSDQIVTAKIVLQTQLELQRLGTHKAVTLLENTEPDLTEWMLEHSTALYHRILETAATPKQARRIHDEMMTVLLVCIRSLQKGHAVLWQAGTGDSLAKQFDSPPVPDEPV